ncbi:hypothetical protein Tco_1475627 [Tanacetum coccineum]
MTTLAEHIIVVGAENRPPMLEKSMYDSRASRICLFIKGKKHGRMMLDSIDNGPLVYPTIKEDMHTRLKKYSELTEAQQLQDDCDVQETNIILHGLPPDMYALVNHQEAAKDIWDRVKLLIKGTELSYQERECRLYNLFDKMTMQLVQVNTKFLNALQPEWSKFVTDVKLAKSLYTTNYDQLYTYLMTQQSQAKFPQLDSGLAVLTFQQGEDLIDCINKAMAFLSTMTSRIEAPSELPKSVENSDLNAQVQEKVFAIAALKNELRKLKEKNIVDTTVSKPSAIIVLGMFKLDIKPISHRLKNNKDAHEVYLEKTIENTDTLRGLVKCDRKQNPSKPLLESACMFTKHIQEFNAYVKHSVRNAKFESICAICNKCLFDANHDMCVIDYANDVNVHSKSKRNNLTKVWKLTGKVFNEIGYSWKPIGCPNCSVVFGLRMLQAYDRKLLSTHQLCLVRGHLKLKYQKDHLCSACALGKIKKHSHIPKAEDSIQEKLYLLHMDLYGPMRIQSISGRKYILVIVDDYSRTPGKTSFFQLPYVFPPIKEDWEILFQLMFDEYFSPLPCVDHPLPKVAASEPIVSTGTPSSTIIDQDAPSTSTSQTNQETPSLVISLGVEEADHDIEVVYMDNNPYVDFPVPEHSSEESSTQVVILNNVHSINQPPEHINKWTKDHPIDNVIGDPSRPVSTRYQLQDEALLCYFNAFLSFVEPKSYKEALTESSLIEAIEEELNEFELLEV